MDLQKKMKILHVAGSPTNTYNLQVSLLYASQCRSGSSFVFSYAVVFPDGRWSFPSSLEMAAVEKAEKVPLHEAMVKMTKWKPDVIHSHLMCVAGQTIYREFLFAIGLPIIGSSPTAYALCKDKGLTRVALNGLKMLTDGLIVQRWNQQNQIDAWTKTGCFPCIVKASDLEDSIGLSVVHHEDNLSQAISVCFDAGAGSVIVEKFIIGMELRVGVIEDNNGDLIMLPVFHYLLSNDQVRSFDLKMKMDEEGNVDGKSAKNVSQFYDMSDNLALKEKLEQLTFTAFRALDLHDFAVFDLRIDLEGRPWLLEVGLFCSFVDTSVINIMAKEAGISSQKLLRMASINAINRHMAETKKVHA